MNMPRKKILLLSPQPFFQWRGSPIRVGFDALAMVEAGFDVDLLTLPIGEKREMEGVRVIRVANPLGVKNIPIGPSLHKIIFDALIFLKGLQLLKKERYVVIHGIEETGIIAVLLSKIHGCKAIFEKHSDPSSYKKGLLKNCFLRLYAGVEKMTVKWANGVIGTGPGLVRQVKAMGFSTPAFHIFDIPSSLVEPASEQIGRVRSELARHDDEVLVTFVGSFAVYQGVDLLLQAIPLVSRRCQNAHFVIIGGTEAEIEERKATLQGEGVAGDKTVSFIGKIAPDILPDYLAASDILLSPRLSGVNTPLKLLDYLKAGRSIVATDVEANRLILDERTSVLAAPVPEVLANAVVNLVEDKEERELLGRNGRKLYEQKYNFQEYCKRLAACYTEVLQ